MAIQHSVPDVAPIVVKPKDARRMLSCGTTRLYELIGAGEIESFLDGRSRKITVESIRRYIARLLPPVGGPDTAPPTQGPGTEAPHRRGPRRKMSTVTAGAHKPCRK